MRRVAVTLLVALVAAAGWAGGRYSRPRGSDELPAQPGPVEFDVKLTRVNYLDPVFVADRPAPLPDGLGTRTVSRITFEGKTFVLVDLHRGDGVPYKSIGLYAPTGEGSHALVLEAESCGAGRVKPELDVGTGVLVLREHARSNLEGQVILSCNLRSVGTYQSVYGR